MANTKNPTGSGRYTPSTRTVRKQAATAVMAVSAVVGTMGMVAPSIAGASTLVPAGARVVADPGHKDSGVKGPH